MLDQQARTTHEYNQMSLSELKINRKEMDAIENPQLYRVTSTIFMPKIELKEGKTIMPPSEGNVISQQFDRRAASIDLDRSDRAPLDLGQFKSMAKLLVAR